MSTTTHPIPVDLFADFADDMEQVAARRQQAAQLSAEADGIEDTSVRRLLRKLGIKPGPNVRISQDGREVLVEEPDATAPAQPDAPRAPEGP